MKNKKNEYIIIDMKRVIFFVVFIIFFVGCKSGIVYSNKASFILKNQSDKIVEFIWITRKGTPYPAAKPVDISKDQIYEYKNLEPGEYDIAIDFKGEYNSFNSKKDPALILKLSEGENKVWIINEDGNIIHY